MRKLVAAEDLLDAAEVADLLGLSRREAVSTYRGRYPSFPAPFIAKNSGKCDLWLRQDIERWAKTLRPATRQRRTARPSDS